ncbi:hypothetical protein Tco_0074955, partial [Tanacetum coccineum]
MKFLSRAIVSCGSAGIQSLLRAVDLTKGHCLLNGRSLPSASGSPLMADGGKQFPCGLPNLLNVLNSPHFSGRGLLHTHLRMHNTLIMISRNLAFVTSFARSCQVVHQFECIQSQFVMFQGIVDIVVIEGLLMKRDIDETGHVMIG